MGNLIIGAVFIIGGLSGKLALIGTNSSMALVVIGAVLMVWGLVRLTIWKPGK